jgi:type I restriction enzyme S subunit
MSDVTFESSTLEKVAALQPGINVSAAAFGSGLPYVTVQDLYNGTRIPVENLRLVEVPASQVERFRLKDGDIVIGKSSVKLEGIGYPSRFRDSESKVLFSGFTLRVQADESLVNGEYLFYWLRSPELRRWLIANAQRSALTNLNSSIIRRIPVKYPNLQVQKRIAEILSTVDDAIQQTEALIAKTQQIKAGLMHDLFTRGVTPDGQLRPPCKEAPQFYKESPLGWIPKEWSCDFLDKFADRGSGHTPNRNIPAYWNGGVKWVSLADSYRLDQLYIDDTEFEISKLGIQNSSAVLHPSGVVVLSRDAGVGKSAITTKPMAVSQHFMCWRCDERLDKFYLYYWLQFKKRMFENIAVGTTIQTIGLPYFRKLQISSPSNAAEQKHIGEVLRAADQEIFDFRTDLEKAKKLKAGLMSDLLSGAVEVSV